MVASSPFGPELQVLTPGVGYGILVGIGAVFTLVMIATTWLQNNYSIYSTKESEEFNTASRSAKPGMIVAGIVSSWTWSATLLTSSTFAYAYGISGPMWYAAVGSSQVLIFAMLALKVKKDSPGAHTFAEIVLARHGPWAHTIYLFFGWATNMFVGATLVVGGADVISGLTGVNVYAACFIIPFAVAVYVIQGGLRSTFVADYIHTVVLFIVIFVFAFTIYTTNDFVGSPGKMWEMLMAAAEATPLVGNAGGSWLTFRSHEGLMFAGLIFLGCFSLVWLDQAYWQRAIASRPETSVKAYLLGGLAWYGIPYGFATAMGLGCVVMTASPSFPTFPNPLNAAQVGGGFSAPATAIALMGKSGAILMIILLFMAITSATSAELIAVSSLWTFDVYKLYINPKASSKTLVFQSHCGILGYSLTLAAFCCGLTASGVDITWILTQGGVIVGGAGIPLGLMVLFPERISTVGAIVAPVVSAPLGIMSWLITTHHRSGSITVATTGNLTNALTGSSVTCGTGMILCLLLSFIFPYRYNSTDPAHLARVDKIRGVATVLQGEDSSTPATEAGSAAGDAETKEVKTSDVEATTHVVATADAPVETGNETVDFLLNNHIEPLDTELYAKARRLALIMCAIFFVFAMVLFPFTFYGTAFIFTKAAFTGWVCISVIWVFFSAAACIIWPVAESWSELSAIGGMVWRDITSKKNK